MYEENEDSIRNHFCVPLSMVLKPGFPWEAATLDCSPRTSSKCTHVLYKVLEHSGA